MITALGHKWEPIDGRMIDREDFIGARTNDEGHQEYLTYNAKFCEPYYITARLPKVKRNE